MENTSQSASPSATGAVKDDFVAEAEAEEEEEPKSSTIVSRQRSPKLLLLSSRSHRR
jgi:hypothetical protein